MNDTFLALPNGDFERFDEHKLDDSRERVRLFELMLGELNFGRTFPWWMAHAEDFGLTKDTIRNDAQTRARLDRFLLHRSEAAI